MQRSLWPAANGWLYLLVLVLFLIVISACEQKKPESTAEPASTATPETATATTSKTPGESASETAAPETNTTVAPETTTTTATTNTSPPTDENPANPPEPVADINAGKTIAEQTCSQCHGLDGATSRNGAPFIAGQQQKYMISALERYKNAGRKDNQNHEALKDMDKAAFINVAAYYNSLSTPWQPQRYVKIPQVTTVSQAAINAGKKKSASCIGCHGADGNSTLDGIPTLAGLQHNYIKDAINAYFNGERKETKIIMQYFKSSVSRQDIKDLAAYFSTLKPVRSPLPSKGNVRAGKTLATQMCSGCHGEDGNSISPTMPSLTGQNQNYLISAIKAYREGRRKNATMQSIAKNLNNAGIQNLSAYFAAQQPKKVVGNDSTAGPYDPLGDGAKIAATCNGCHGANGNSTTKGIPSLSRLQPKYLTTAIKAYQSGSRKNDTMNTLVSLLSDSDIEKISWYYATQEPKASTNPKPGKADKAQELSATCNGCHGENGNSTDPGVPAIAGQDATYIVDAIQGYASGKRENETMANAIKELSKEQIRDVATFYATQTPEKPQGVNLPLSPQELAAKCDRCHGENGMSQDPEKPRLAGQIQAYLEKALNDYRNGNRESSMMHAMAATDVMSVTELKAITAYYSQK